jgi:hypothetical protein
MFVINQSVPGSGNIDIINSTKSALAELTEHNIKPIVFVGLSEAGRNFKDEIGLVPKQGNATEFLKSILVEEFNMLQNELAPYQSYIFTSWVHNPTGTKSIIDFIEEDFTQVAPVYAVQNNVYKLLNKMSFINKESFVEAVDNKQRFEALLLKNKYINTTLHLEWETSDQVYEKFFSHVLSTLNVSDDK